AASIEVPWHEDLEILERSLEADVAEIEPFYDAAPTLQSLKSLGIRTAVVSNLATPYKRPFSFHQLDLWVDVVVFSCDCGLLKPDPRIYELALKQLDVEATEAIMVGDSCKADVDGPARIGIRGVHLVRSGESESSSAVTIASLAEIVEMALG
ncbi:MAG: HAD family hydrolase, partial [Planctomycetales bacterium]|nr:HAD family hydrolase [Planctomycetales bacterium]